MVTLVASSPFLYHMRGLSDVAGGIGGSAARWDVKLFLGEGSQACVVGVRAAQEGWVTMLAVALGRVMGSAGTVPGR